jgi:S-adenosylmethionine:tRNA ribosyltransferase-isomerase
LQIQYLEKSKKRLLAKLRIINFNFVEKFKNITIEDYTYDLPPARIAHYPLKDRDTSSLLIYRNNQVSKDVFKSIHNHLPGDSLIVFNNTRVVQARLLFQKDTGAQIEIFCLEPHGEVKDIQLAFQQKGRSSWLCLVGNAKKWKKDTLIFQGHKGLVLKARKGDPFRDGFIIEFEWLDENLSFAEVLDEAGKTPLPPYIPRKAEDDDKVRYQTIYARHSGSVAAPTAGLHFTKRVMDSLEGKNIKPTWLTLHVGAGTFKPVSSPTMEGHDMHHEQIIFSKESVEELLAYCNKTIISVGTTSLRSLESLYWLGAKIEQGYKVPEAGFSIAQWEPYELKSTENIPVRKSLQAVLDYMSKSGMPYLHGETSLIIVPGYKIMMADILVTNFHQPKSTLLLLVAAFCGENWKTIYTFALENGFRFLSYGDSCLLIREPLSRRRR